jgi:hypothetical protein
MSAKTTNYAICLILLAALGCGSSGDDDDASSGATGGQGANGGTDPGSGGTTDQGGSSGSTTGGTATGGASASGGASGNAASSGKGGASGKGGGGSGGGGGDQIKPIPSVPGEPCNSVDSALPEKPCMVNVSVRVSGNAADVQFDPVDGAVDYRVYELPDDADITATGDNLSVKNAIYRCAGNRMAQPVTMDGAAQVQDGAMKTLVDGMSVGGYKRSLADAKLGYVSAVPGDGLVPVYALGEPGKDGDNSCYWMRWTESRVKQYVTSEADRKALLAKGYRDDGIAFYVPEGGDGTSQVLTSTDTGVARYYFTDGPEAGMRKDAKPAFSAFSAEGDGRIPLMRVFYQNGCGMSHDELVGGMARFERAREQGDTHALNEVHWSGLTGQTTLVVEALADGCPRLPGILAPESRPAYTNGFGNPEPPWLSLDDAKALSSTGEVYVNGQFDEKSKPRPIARSFVKVKPAAAPDLDWFEGFDTQDAFGKAEELPCGHPINCTGQFRWGTDAGDLAFASAEEGRHAYGSVLGEMWIAYADYEADTPGKFRFTAPKEGELKDDRYLYATMDVNAFTTARRYPQLIISDQQVPVQWNLPKGRSLVIQTFGDWPYLYQLEVCDHRDWDVNNQCPTVDSYRYFEQGTTDRVQSLAPNAEVGESTGPDRTTHFEVWISPSRAYLALDGAPYSCINLPSGAPGAGPVTVTFGDTLYHSGVDALDNFQFMLETFRTDTTRHFDNLGFKSGVAAPAWDESRLPCVDFPETTN